MNPANQAYNNRIIRALFIVIGVFAVFAVSSAPVSAAVTDAVHPIRTVSLIYGAITVFSLALLLGYCGLVRKKEIWFLLLYISVFIVNLGYFALSISTGLEEALLANRIAYFGSVFLPLFMLMIIVDICGIRYRKVFFGVLLGISILVFLSAASGGYLDLYYKEVHWEIVNGVVTLDKVYGPLHALYPVYLFSYFGMMVGMILFSVIRKRVPSYKHAAIIAVLAMGNILVWLVEQVIHLHFEFLSVSYLVTELFLLFLHNMLQDYELIGNNGEVVEEKEILSPGESAFALCSEGDEICEGPGSFSGERLSRMLTDCPAAAELTAREREVLGLLLENKRRKEIADELHVSENTVKKHTSHVFAKLNVSSRKELFALVEKEISPSEP
ncbi:MAG: LuxR C-terminal-related transcriptional regulator [Clostridia bacterium]